MPIVKFADVVDEPLCFCQIGIFACHTIGIGELGNAREGITRHIENTTTRNGIFQVGVTNVFIAVGQYGFVNVASKVGCEHFRFKFLPIGLRIENTWVRCHIEFCVVKRAGRCCRGVIGSLHSGIGASIFTTCITTTLFSVGIWFGFWSVNLGYFLTAGQHTDTE